MSKQQQANQAAYKIYENARKDAARAEDIIDWQRLNRMTRALDVAIAQKEG